MTAPPSPAEPLRLAVLISGGGSTLANLICRMHRGRLENVAIQLVISSRSKVRGVEIAREAGRPLRVIRKQDYVDVAAFSDALVSALDQARAELVVMGGFLCLWHIPPRYQGRVLNIHPALLPGVGGQGCYGHHVHEAVLAAGLTESGCTVHLADNEYDHGPVVARRRVPVFPGDTPESLASRIQRAERELYPDVIQRVADEGVEVLGRMAEQFKVQS
jgi:phosphoribosylglycinamide formyltransferase 1